MKFEPTPQQDAAINAKGCILVSAAAGSGKTAVLVERVIKMLTDRDNPVYADRLLIVTFTNAAAAEMLARIESRLYEELENNPDDQLINRQRYLIKSADICTIDSFCIRLVRDNFSDCGIEPDFKVTDDNSLFPVRREVLNGIISYYLSEPSDTFKMLMKITDCGYDEGNLIKLLDDLYISSKKMPFSSEFIKSLIAPYITPFGKEHPWYKSAFVYANEVIKDIKKDISDLAEAAVFAELYDKATMHAEVISNVICEVESAIISNDWNILYETLRSSDFGKSPSKCGEQFKELKARIVGNIKKLRDIFAMTVDCIQLELTEFRPAIELLCEISEQYSKKVFERLKEENTFSFDDVEQMAISMLAYTDSEGNIVRTEQAKSIISRYDEVLVDEFQDVNDLQNTLFEILSDDSKHLFIVGDVKQSIYAFRGSNPDIFLNKKNVYGDYFTQTENNAKKILLADNFRSRKGICDAVNFFFSKLMTKDVGDLLYGTEEMLNYGADYKECEDADTDILVIDKVDDESDDSVIESESSAIAKYIKDKMKQDAFLRDENGGLRTARYGDFCILLAALRNKAGVIAEKLKEYGIPAKVNDGDFFGSTEITVALSLLRIIDNPRRDVELLCVLMSPIYNFTAEDMAKIRAGRTNVSLYSALCDYARVDNKATKFLSEISALRDMSCLLPVNKFVSHVIDKTNMMNIFYSLPDGELRAENLSLLMKFANDYSGGSHGSIYGFLKYLEAMPADSVKVSAPTDENCIKIMSIHHSNGLQFPICIVACLSAQINKSDIRERTLYSFKYGIGFKYLDKSDLEKKENMGHKILALQNKRRIAQERLRLLYVAMTRAEEKLCLVCCLKNAQIALQNAAKASNMGNESINGRFIVDANSSAPYILAAALTHPDAQKLRDVSECKIIVSDTDSRINIEYLDVLREQKNEKIEQENCLPDSVLADMIRENIKYEYPFEQLKNVPAKTSVSLMANKAESERYVMTERPAFMENDGLSATDRGTVIHKIMQYIDFTAVIDINLEIKRLISEHRITEREASAITISQIQYFFESPIYKRICASHDVRREMRFLTELPVSSKKISSDDTFIVQGAVDLCFAENGGVVVVDFKTDRVDNMEKLKDAYSAQLDIYAGACEKIFGMPVKEKIIYSFHLSKMISV